jgi:hypothetical protein
MSQIISCSIDVTKIDKSKLIEGKNGAKYFNFTVTVNDEPDQYGKDCSIALSQTKEEREAKAKRTFIGSGKTIWRSTAKHTTVKPQQDEPQSSELPF